MAIEINDDFVCLEFDGVVIAGATKRVDGWWEVSHWPQRDPCDFSR
jgi:hypothetical protein